MRSFKGRQENGEPVEIVVQGRCITEVRPLHEQESLPYVLPVLVDLQQNGALGIGFDALAEQDVTAVPKIIHFLRRHGIGRILATLTTYPYEALQHSVRHLAAVLQADSDLDAMITGIFHEGIFISAADGWRGAHAKEWLLQPDYERVKRLDDISGNRIRMVNVAPEEPGGLDFVTHAAAAGKIVAIGHADPHPETVREAVQRGASLVTHFGNGAPGFIHRHCNPLWTFLSEADLSLSVICDGFHLPPEVVRTVFRCKKGCQVLPVSDASQQSGLLPGRYFRPNGTPMIISRHGRIHLEGEENILAGAWFQLDRGVEYLVRELGMSFLEAWNQCSRIPAAFIGVRLPQIKAGEEASFVLAQWHDGVVIQQAVHLGKAYLQQPLRPRNAVPEADA